jgi:H+/Cl- antiporter ClcA
MLLAAVVGTLTGLATVGFGGLLDLAEWIFFDQFNDRLMADLPSWPIVIVPVIGSLLVGPIVTRFAHETRGQGVSDVMLAVETTSGRIRARVAPMMALATALTVGSGGSAGPQGPVVQIGAGLGSTVAQWLRLSNENIRLLAAAGAAVGSIFVRLIYSAEDRLTSLLLRLFALKPFAAAALGSGGSGGAFRPALFLGALTGGLFGAAAHGALPTLTATGGAYATVSMAATFASVSQAPISAVLMLFEMTRDYDIMVPLMTAVATATFAAQLFVRGSIYTIGLERRGVTIEAEPGPVSVMESLAVADAMPPSRSRSLPTPRRPM